MITSKDTARDLVNRYLQIYDGRVQQAKQCALIAANVLQIGEEVETRT